MYIVAYRDKNGNDWNGLPWLEAAYYDIELAKQLAVDMIAEGYQEVVLFQDYTYGTSECVTWTEVYNNKVDLD